MPYFTNRGITPLTAPDSAELSQFLARITTPDGTHRSAYAALIDGLVADGLWTKLDALYIFAAADATTAKVNLRQSSFGLTTAAEPTFTPDTGYVGNGTTMILNTNFTPSSAGGQFTLNSAHFAMYITTSSTANCGDFFGSDDASTTRLNLIATTGVVQYNISSSGAGSPAISNVQGLWCVNRPSAGTRELFKNASSTPFDTGAASGGALESTHGFTIMKTDDGSSNTANASACCFGSGLSGANYAALAARLKAYMTVFGISVF